MSYTVFRKTLRDVRNSTIAVGAVLALIALADVLLFPSYQESLKGFNFPDALKVFFGEAGSIATPKGFIAAEFFSWIPLLLITVAIISATGSVAGEEAAGTLEYLLAQPISRGQLLVQKTLGLLTALSAATLVAYPALVAGTLAVDFDVGRLRLFETVANMLPVTMLYLAVAVFGSVALPSRAAAATLAIGAVVAAYFLNTVGAAVELLDGPRRLSPFYWSDAGHVLVHGFDWLRAGGLVAVTVVLFLAALWLFDRRDIASGRRDWNWLPARRHRG